jgi:hypothetical protein
MQSIVFREVSRFIALGVCLAFSANRWVRVRRTPKGQRGWYIAAAVALSCLTVVTIVDIVLDL